MKLAIMQPYFFPYLGYFSLIKYTNQFIAFDTAQYNKHGWMHRNRILHPGVGNMFISVPTHKTTLATKINEVKINNTIDWEKKILDQFVHYKKKSPNYYRVVNFIEECFSSEVDNLSKLNIHLLQRTCDYLNIPHNITALSEMNLSLGVVNSPDEWALNISKELKADIYVNAPGGKNFFDSGKYSNANIDLQFINSNLPKYYQGREGFEKGLSILDVMMFNSVDQIEQMLNDHVVT